MKKFYLLFLLFCVLNTNLLKAQHFFGFEGSPFAGLYGIDANPTSIVGSPFGFELNLGTLSGSIAGNNIGFIGDSDISKDFYPVLNERGIIESPIKVNGRFLARGLSTAFQVGNNAFAITFDVKGMGYARNVPNEVYQFMENSSSKSLRDQDRVMVEDMVIGSHTWGEIGIAYGRSVYSSNSIEIKAAGRLKLRIPYEMNHMEVKTLEMDLTDPLYINLQNADVSLIEMDGIENVSAITKNSSYGGDIGLSLEYRPNFKYLAKDALYKYKYKVGLALIDIGKLKDKLGNLNGVNVKGDINNYFTYQDGDRRFDDTFYRLRTLLPERTNIDNNVSLPTSLKAQFDYQMVKGWYINATAVLPLSNKNLSMVEITSLTITPRLDLKRFSLFVPVIYDQYKLNFGLGLRAGPVVFGLRFPRINSDEWWENIGGYAGVRVAIFKKNKEENPAEEGLEE